MDCGKNLSLQESKNNLEDNNKCIICHKDEITYSCMPCRCEILCKKCAQKMATGGKCKKCHELFSECRRIIK
jgi:hypothetical protein